MSDGAPASAGVLEFVPCDASSLVSLIRELERLLAGSRRGHSFIDVLALRSRPAPAPPVGEDRHRAVAPVKHHVRGRTRSKGGATRPGEPLSFSRYYSVNEEPLGPFADDHHAGEICACTSAFRVCTDCRAKAICRNAIPIASLVKEVH